MSTSKPPNRFVPTLTEVVRPGPAPLVPTVDCDQLVDQVLMSLKPRLEQQLRAALQTQVEEQMRLVAAQWQLEIEDAVRDAVTQATTAPLPPLKF